MALDHPEDTKPEETNDAVTDSAPETTPDPDPQVIPDNTPTPDTSAPDPPAAETTDATPKQADPTPPVYKEVPISEDLEHAFSRVATHPNLIQATVSVHIASGITRLRAAGQTVLYNIHDRRRRSSWEYMRRRRDTRQRYLAVLAQKLVYDESSRLYGSTLYPEKVEKVEWDHQLLAREVPPVDKRFWTSLGRWERRKMVVHMYVMVNVEPIYPWTY